MWILFITGFFHYYIESFVWKRNAIHSNFLIKVANEKYIRHGIFLYYYFINTIITGINGEHQ